MNWMAIIILIVSILYSKKVLSQTANEDTLYEDCTIYNDSSIHGGEICGTDAVTYPNWVYLDCVNYKNLTNIATMHLGPCSSGDVNCILDPIYDPVCGSDSNTYSNYQVLLCNNYRESANVTVISNGECTTVDYCARNGINIDGQNRVCASNGLTYLNEAQVKCLQKYNASIKILHDSGCTVSHVYSMYGAGKTVCSIARQRYEWNPVCGSDLVTYPNPFIFLCYRSDLEVIFNGECNTDTMEACVTAHKNDTYVNGTLTNNDFTADDQVCGNDGHTYQSIYHLICNSYYNKYLSDVHEGPCTGPDDNPCGAATEVNSQNAVCGSDGFSYISPQALWCVKRSLKSDLTYVHDGPC
ncbi:serine protease inhibitor dipetalogastin [Cephus cinctus]|uniref:Serine protease inhibitor dipetalogastin n=1 Tax=Cephus cinctus TaxID=211228 RepID=A0AAJ7FN56_CEPCN|nr:serine protease inhibitor dipetalogastin [Cephus cinctus]